MVRRRKSAPGASDAAWQPATPPAWRAFAKSHGCSHTQLDHLLSPNALSSSKRPCFMRSDLADSQSPSSRLLPAANWSQEQQKHSQRQRAYDATRRTSDGQHYGYKPPRRKKEKKSADFLLAECKILTCPMRAFFLSLPRPFLLLHHRVDKRGLHFIALTNAVGSPPSPCQRGNNATRGDIGGIRRANGEKSQQKSMARVMVAVIRDSLNNKEWLWWSFGNFPRTGRKMQQHCDVRSPES